MLFVIVFLLVALIVNGFLGDFIKGTDFGLTSTGLTVSFSAILAVGAFWNIALLYIAVGLLFSIVYTEFNDRIYS